MAKGEIVSHKGSGLYSVKLKYAIAQIKSELVKVNKRIVELAVEVPSQKVLVIQAEVVASDLARDIDLLIPAYMADPVGTSGPITDLQVKLVSQRGEIAKLTYARDKLIAENLILLKRRSVLEGVPEEKLVDAWCADYSESLTGDVGLADVNDEGSQGVIIRPGYNTGAVYNATSDGILMPREAQSGAQVYFNAAVLPGVQKWRPRYRVGVVSELVDDTCSITLDDAFSSAQRLDINQHSSLEGVPILYMDCNGTAFENGDRVLVRFTVSGPLVVGFEKEPRPCGMFDFIFIPSKGLGFFSAMTYGEPLTGDGAVEINPPLGTENGANPAWVAKKSQTSSLFDFDRGQGLNYGAFNWIGSKKSEILSWIGTESRVCDVQLDERRYFSVAPTRGPFVYFRNAVIFDSNDFSGDLPYNAFFVEGAALNHRDGKTYLRICLSNFNAAIERNENYHLRMYEISFDLETYELGALTFLDGHNFSFAGWHPISGMYFSGSGDKAVQTVASGGSSTGQRTIVRLAGGAITTELITQDYSGVRIKSPLFNNKVRPPLPDGHDRPNAAGWTTGRSEISDTHSNPNHDFLLYVEMFGEQEKWVTLRSPAYLEVNTHTTNRSASVYLDRIFEEPGQDPVKVYERKPGAGGEAWTTSEDSGSLEIRCDGKVLASIEGRHYRNLSDTLLISAGSDYTGNDRTFTFTHTDVTHTKSLTPEYVHIDARSGFVAACVFEKTISESASAGGSYTTGEDDTYTLYGDTATIWHFAAWKDGKKIIDEETYRQESPYGPDTNSYRNLVNRIYTFDPLPGTYPTGASAFSGIMYNPTITRYLGPAPRMIYRPISWCSSAGDSTMAAASFVFRKQGDEYAAFTAFHGYNDPVSQIIDRSSNDVYFFSEISLI